MDTETKTLRKIDPVSSDSVTVQTAVYHNLTFEITTLEGAEIKALGMLDKAKKWPLIPV